MKKIETHKVTIGELPHIVHPISILLPSGIEVFTEHILNGTHKEPEINFEITQEDTIGNSFRQCISWSLPEGSILKFGDGLEHQL